MTRFIFLLAFGFSNLIHATAGALSFPANTPVVITTDSIFNPNCLSANGYIGLSASGGSGGYAFLWNTGNKTPVLYPAPVGKYTVTVTDSNGDSAELEISLDGDFTPPTADAGAPLNIVCANELVTLNGSGSSGPTFSYQWTATNGGHLLSGANTLTPEADHAGVFRLVVTNTANGCTAAAQTTVTAQHEAPFATATGGTITCFATSITLGATYDTLHTVFAWHGPNGFFSNKLHPVVNVPGGYHFVVTDTLSDCVSDVLAGVGLNTTPPDASASAGGVLSCLHPSVLLNGNSNTPYVQYSWSGPGGFASTLQNPSVNTPGWYTLTVKNTVNGCTAPASALVGSNLLTPTVTATANSAITCANANVQLTGSSNIPASSYAWTGPGGYTSTVISPLVGVAGLYQLTVTATSSGCTGVASAIVQQNTTAPGASAAGGLKTCANPSVTLSGASPTSTVAFNWTGPGGFSSTLPNPSVSSIGAYVLLVTNIQNGCTSQATATVSQNTTPPGVTATGGTITCTSPQLKLTANSNTSGVNYAWTGPNNFVSNQQNPLVSKGGYYLVTATNPVNGCTNMTTVFVSENTAAPIALAGEDKSLNCFFNNVVLNASFSSSGNAFTYNWTTDDGNIVSGGKTVYPRVDLAGTYTLTVTNVQNGCTAVDEATVVQRAPVSADISSTTPVSCSGGANGSATVTPGGGSGDFTIKWSDGSKNAKISGLTAGMYSVTVTDTEGCSDTSSTVVGQLVLLGTIYVTAQTIPGVNNGSASIIPGGGTAPYTLNWSNGQTGTTISGLAPGQYAVTITDASGCTLAKTTHVNAANCTLAGALTTVNASCFGLANGSATVTPTGAAGAVTYLWSNNAKTQTVTGLAAGAYKVTVTDAAGCPLILTAQISSPQALLASISAQNDVLCPGMQDGSLTAAISGGTQPYNYSWSNGKKTATIAALAPGTYFLTATDAKSCTVTLNAQVNSPQPIEVSVQNKTDVLCPNGADGSISISASGGVAPLYYLWSTGNTTSAISGLVPGAYNVTVTDSHGCPKSLSNQIVVSDKKPPVLVLKNASVDLEDAGAVTVSPSLFDNGSADAECGIVSWAIAPNTFNCSQIGQHIITLSATDLSGNTSTGTAILVVKDSKVPTLNCPPNVTVGACNPVVTYDLPQVDDNCPLVPAQLVRLNGLPSGAVFPVGSTTVSYRYVDLAENTGLCSFEVVVAAPLPLETAVQAATCANACDGSASLNAAGNAIVSSVWNNGQNGTTATGLCPGTYTAVVSDVFGCTQTLAVDVTGVDKQAPTLTCPENITVAHCFGAVSYNTPLAADNCTVNPASMQQLNGLPSGAVFPVGTTVQLFVYTDAGGNSTQCSFSVHVTEAPAQNIVLQTVTCSGACDGAASISLIGGSAPFSIQWSNGQTGASISNLCAGNYTVTVVDAAGCQKISNLSIIQPPPLVHVVDQVIQDIGNAGNGQILVSVAGGKAPYHFNWTRNGQFFASTEDLLQVPAGVYVLEITDANGCVRTSAAIVVNGLVDNAEPEWAQNLVLQPNPASSSVQLVFGQTGVENLELRLFDARGRLARTPPLETTENSIRFDVSNLPGGIWMVSLRAENGQSVVRKLVVNH